MSPNSQIQFLAFFRFRPNPQLSSRGSQPIELIGLVPNKIEKESFWVSPSHLQTDNNLQGQLFDQICEDNIILM